MQLSHSEGPFDAAWPSGSNRKQRTALGLFGCKNRRVEVRSRRAEILGGIFAEGLRAPPPARGCGRAGFRVEARPPKGFSHVKYSRGPLLNTAAEVLGCARRLCGVCPY